MTTKSTETQVEKGGGVKKLILPWRGIQVRITYEPDYSTAVKHIHGYQLAHITLQAETPLPISETGFRSIFLAEETVREAGGVVAYTHQLLNETAKSKQWKSQEKQKNQLTLF